MVEREDVRSLLAYYTSHAEGNSGCFRGDVLFGTNFLLFVSNENRRGRIKKQKTLIYQGFQLVMYGDPDWVRTSDPHPVKMVLSQLSYRIIVYCPINYLTIKVVIQQHMYGM